jgi:hypothetical protein
MQRARPSMYIIMAEDVAGCAARLLIYGRISYSGRWVNNECACARFRTYKHLLHYTHCAPPKQSNEITPLSLRLETSAVCLLSESAYVRGSRRVWWLHILQFQLKFNHSFDVRRWNWRLTQPLVEDLSRFCMRRVAC